MATPLIARGDVGEVDLDRRHGSDLERIANRVAVVRPSAGVEHYPIRDLGQAVQPLNVLAFAVRAKEARLESELVGEALHLHLELVQRGLTVMLARTPPQHVEVD